MTIKVNKQKKYFERDGKRWFYLADTAWELLRKLSKEELLYYLDERQSQGFNAIQFVYISEFGNMDESNTLGLRAVDNVTLEKISLNKEYLEFTKWVLGEINARDMVAGIVICWGNKYIRKLEQDQELFTPESAYKFALEISNEFADYEKVIILGGDRNPQNELHYQIINSMAKGIKDGNSCEDVITYHVEGGSRSSDFFREKDWLDFSVYQSGHTKYVESLVDGKSKIKYATTSYEYAKIETSNHNKPFLNGEPCYENHTRMYVDKDHNWLPIESPRRSYFNDFDVRKDLYWSVFEGACGFVYGANDIWQFSSSKDQKKLNNTESWLEALTLPGAKQVCNIHSLINDFNDCKIINCNEIICNNSSDIKKLNVACTNAIDLIYIYCPYRQDIELNLSKFQYKQINVEIINPASFKTIEQCKLFESKIILPVGLDFLIRIKLILK